MAESPLAYFEEQSSHDACAAEYDSEQYSESSGVVVDESIQLRVPTDGLVFYVFSQMRFHCMSAIRWQKLKLIVLRTRCKKAPINYHLRCRK